MLEQLPEHIDPVEPQDVPQKLVHPDLLIAELQLIAARREKAGFRTQETGDDAGLTTPAEDMPSKPVARGDSLVGLAFSGGGIRSAAFNLGLAQALHDAGLYRFVDFLSSVSGGSFISAMLSQGVSSKGDYNRSSFPYRSLANGRQQGAVRQLVNHGNYLIRLDLLANRYVAGLLLTCIPLISLLIVFGAGAAWLWRSLDSYFVRDRMAALGLSGDVAPALLPAMVLAAAWGLAWVMALVLRSEPLKHGSNILFWTMLICLLIGGTLLLGNGDISRGGNRGEIRETQHYLSKILVTATGLGLLPLLRPDRLIRSGVAPQRYLESWVFYYTSVVLLLGLPLMAVAFFARENVSGYASGRVPVLLPGEFKDLETFCQWLQEPDIRQIRAGGRVYELNSAVLAGGPRVGDIKPAAAPEPKSDSPETSVRDAAGKLTKQTPRTQAAGFKLLGKPHWRGEPLQADASGIASFSQSAAQTAQDKRWMEWRYWWYFRRWSSFLASFFEPNTDYRNYLAQVWGQREHELELCRTLNTEVLSAPDLFKVRLASDADKNIPELTSSDLRPDDIDLLARFFETDSPPPLAGADETVTVNRRLLELLLPTMIRPSTDVRRTTVYARDQRHRLVWFVGALACLLVSGLWINPNTTSLHDYFRDRIGVAFLGEPVGIPKESRGSLANCRPHERGAPYPIFGAAVSDESPLVHPTQLEARFSEFTLSPAYCGSDRLGYVRTDRYVAEPELSVADTAAISGAAISPNYFVHHIVIALMTLLNLRLGKWLPNPLFAPLATYRPRLLLQYRSDFQPEIERRKIVQVTDGGHVENLGLGALLRRRCRLIILSDAGQDSDFAFADFARLLRRFRNDYGVEFLELDGEARLSVAGRFPRRVMEVAGQSKTEQRAVLDKTFGGDRAEHRHFFVARIRYPDETQPSGILFYVKPCLTGNEDADLYNYALNNPHFPHDSTADQAFSVAQFESYRRLGAITGEDLCSSLRNGPNELWGMKSFDCTQLLLAIDAPLSWVDIHQLHSSVNSLREQDEQTARDLIKRVGDRAVPFYRQLLELDFSAIWFEELSAAGVVEIGRMLRQESLSAGEKQLLVDVLVRHRDQHGCEAAVEQVLKELADCHSDRAVRAAAQQSLRSAANHSTAAAERE